MSKKKQTNWQDINQQIFQKLDMQAEYESLGLEFNGSGPNGNGWLECYPNKSAAININSGRFRDLGGEGENLSFWDYCVHVKRFSKWTEARDFYAAKVGIKLDDSTKDPGEHLAFQPWNDALASLWCRNKKGVTVESLRANGARLARYREQYSVISLPVFGAGFCESPPIGYVLYNVTSRELPIFHGKGKPITWAKMKTTGGSEGGLIGQWAIDRLTAADADPSQQLIWKVEGPSDLLALWAAMTPDEREANLILTNSGGATEAPKPWMQSLFAGRRVGVVGDADVPGQKGAATWAAWACKAAGETRVVAASMLGYETAKDHGKDLRDFFTNHTYADLLAIYDAAEIVLDNAPPPAVATQEGPCGPGAVAEADDDPHRLARVNLERYATRNDGRTLAFWRDEWYVWKRNAYRKITPAELRAKLSASIKNEFDRICIEKRLEAEQRPARDGDEKEIVSQRVTMQLVSNVIQATSGMVCVSGDIEPNTWMPTRERRTYISMANGILDIDAVLADRDDYLLPNSPKWFSMVSLPYEFIPEAACPRWNEFLEYNLELDHERIKFLQEWAGYLLTPSTDEQAFLILEGEGKNGKSVFISGLCAMLGKENISHVALESFGERFELTQTIGKLLNAVDDCGDLDKVAEGRLKTFVSGAAMFFDRKGVEGYSQVPTARLMVACNARPRFNDRSNAIWRRMKVIPWRLSVSDEKQIKGMDKANWWERSGELPGIFWWALQGLARLRAQNGFTRVRLMEESIAEYQEEMNPARVFLHQYLEPNNSGMIRSSELYKVYKKWIEENGYRPLAERTFGKEVKRVFPCSDRVFRGDRSHRFYCYEKIQFSQDEICGIKVNDLELF